MANSIRFDKDLKDISVLTLRDLYKVMLKIRKLQNKIEEEYPRDEMKTPIHLCIGQEAIPAGICANLRKDDYVFSNYRGHGHYIAKGGDLKALVSELYGRETGCSRGRGGSMHLIDASVGLMGSSSIVAGCIPIATGAALGSLLKKDGRVSVVFFSDGAADEGVLYESINFAALKKLPVIYACENNFYAVCSPQKNRQPLDNISERFKGCAITGRRIDGNNVIDVYRAARDVVNKARKGKGPSLIEFRTYRWRGHSGGGSDMELGYRPEKELEEWKGRCPLRNFERFLIKEKIISKTDIKNLDGDIAKEIDEAFKIAKDGPLPRETDLLKYVYKDED